MAKGKSSNEILNMYDQKIKIYQDLENEFLNKLSLQAKQSILDLLAMTEEDSQNKEIDQAISDIENLISHENIATLGKNAQEVQQKIASQLLEIDKDFKVLGDDVSGLKALAEGNYNKAITAYTKGIDLLVSNADLNDWIVKIMKRIDLIKSKNQNKSFTGYLSNLKGAYLESAIMSELNKRLVIDISSRGSVYQTGNIKAGNRQIAEDLIVTWGDESRENLEKVLNNESFKTKSKRISIPVPIYQEIQKTTAGISVKAGKSPIKYFEGNLDPFFEETDQDIAAYHQNVLLRAVKKMNDNEKGRSVNKYLVARNIQKAVGENNLFISTRNNLLMRMSSKLKYLRDNDQLYMNYKSITNSIKGRITE